jgi:hypothetical protein
MVLGTPRALKVIEQAARKFGFSVYQDDDVAMDKNLLETGGLNMQKPEQGAHTDRSKPHTLTRARRTPKPE